jgi:2',3'-cyclic-nucleotide 2'-phosphodiesterase (5'-nucleotidase family)
VANLVAQSYLAAFPEADLVIQHAGTVRGDIAQGNFTAFDAEVLLPLRIRLVLIPMTGSEIQSALE